MPSQEHADTQEHQCEGNPPDTREGSRVNPESKAEVRLGSEGESSHKNAPKEEKGRSDKLSNKLNTLARRVEITDWIVAVCTVVIAIATVVNVVIVKGQLNEMESSSTQADLLVKAATRQADAIGDLRNVATGQLAAVREQLEAAVRQQQLTVIQTRANIRKEGISAKPFFEGGRKKGWMLNSILRNVGGTDALDFVMMWGITKAPHATVNGCPAIESSFNNKNRMVMTPGEAVIQAALGLSIEDVIRASNKEIDIFIVGRTEYRDIFPNTPTHRYEWCVRVVPNNINEDVFSFINVAEYKE